MIKLSKGEQPEVLVKKAKKWTAVVQEKLDAGLQPNSTDKRRYNHPNIKAALLDETHSKCAYCESKFGHVTFGDIEHVVPKSIDPKRWFDWSNLTIACDVCNTKKSNAEIDHETFVDPYAVDPEEYFHFLGHTIFPRPGSDAANLTQKLLGLNRERLLERRKERLDNLWKHLDIVVRCENPELKKLLWEDFLQEAHEGKEYAALARMVVREATGSITG